jgi:hypothetical protein
LGTFSTNLTSPRFKLESHIKELELYNKINEFLRIGKVIYTVSRKNDIDMLNDYPTIILEVKKIKYLKYILIPLMYGNNYVLLKTLNQKYFLLWSKLVDINYNGYHIILEGKYIFEMIKLHMNDGLRPILTTSQGDLNPLLLKDKIRISLTNINQLLSKLYLIESPYETINGERYIRGTNTKIFEGTKIIVIDEKNNRKIYDKVECSKYLNISQKIIKKYLISGLNYKGYIFVLS